ncbi:T9SS type A sorting domain-containing protein [bacterium]|nr:T9SS type A sorting domain-containing protein [bacterium]
MKYGICILGLLLIATAVYAVETAPYFPIAVNYMWEYQDSAAEGYTTTTSTITGTTEMEGHTTFILEDTHEDMSVDTTYYQVREDGYYFYLLLGSPEFGLDFGMIAVKMFPTDISVGEEWTAFAIDTALEIMGFPVDVQMDVTSEFVGYGDVVTPMGSFYDCIKIVSTNVWNVDAGVIFSDSGTTVMSITYYSDAVGIARETQYDITSIFMGGDPSATTSLLTDYELEYIDDTPLNRPQQFNIGAYPNPFNSQCMIDAPVNSKVDIYDLQGKLIEHFDFAPATWQPEAHTSSNIYLVKVTTNAGYTKTSKLIYLK